MTDRRAPEALRDELLALVDAWNGRYGDKGLRLKAERTQVALRAAAEALGEMQRERDKQNAHCRKVCMGYPSKGVRHWVAAERVHELESQLSASRLANDQLTAALYEERERCQSTYKQQAETEQCLTAALLKAQEENGILRQAAAFKRNAVVTGKHTFIGQWVAVPYEEALRAASGNSERPPSTPEDKNNLKKNTGIA